jgi:eukaryotic-like serine/threonine-protein kinase
LFLRRSIVEGGEALDASVGTVLGGRYRVSSTLGSGGMAVVYKAEDAILGRTVALKTLHRHYAEEPAFRRRFKQEARAMASLDHENIVKVYDICQEGDIPFIVAECVGGRDVGSLLAEARGGRLNEGFTRRIAAQLLSALQYAHERGIIHRDIKPSNILITPDGTVKVADFGIARIVEDEDDGEPGEIIGSARYMSPEQLRGGEATPASDIYSVGILLYHCLTGEPPFSGQLDALARQHVKKAPTPPRKRNREISRHLENVILAALEKDPADRYPSAEAMLADLDEPSGVAWKTAEAPREEGPKKEKRRRALILTPVAALLLVGGGTALAAGMGIVDVPGRASSEDGLQDSALSRAQSVAGGPAVEAPSLPDETPAAEKDAAAAENEATSAVMVPVPDVREYYDYSAEEILVNDGFEVEIVYAYQEGYADRGVAWGTDPAIGTMAPVGSTITVYATPEDLRQPQIES